jgi:predicted amidohydrolase
MRYKALALQTTCYAVNAARTATEAQEQMLRSLERIGRQIQASKRFIGPDLRLVVLPEYFLSGFPIDEDIPAWKQKACLSPDDPLWTALGIVAKREQVFLSGNAYEWDEHFPELYFQCSFIFDPSGRRILNYRRLNSMFAPTPHDVWDRYLDIYGLEAVFPVADTEIGRLACIASEEILYPEIARCLVMRGAEIFLHSTSEVGSPILTPKKVCALARALENMAYLVSANSAGIAGIDIPMASADGGSKIVDYEGRVLCEAGFGESMVANATLDVDALRAYRARPGMSNYLARQRFELFADSYARHSFYPPNTFINKSPQRADFLENIRRAAARWSA